VIKLEEANYIRYLHEIQDKTITEICETVNHNYRTVAKCIETSEPPKYNRVAKYPLKKLEPYKTTIDSWLEEDMKRPRKQRHTAARVHNRLKDEFNVDISDRSVRAYVSKKKKELSLKKQEAFLRLKHYPAEAQADFGELEIDYKGNPIKAYYFVLSFPYSNAAFTQVFESCNTECLLEGMNRIFNFCGGVPNVIWFDNMTTAVKEILKHGEREVTERFMCFQNYYRFESNFCNPAKANEKGNVEAKVGYVRRNLFVPVPAITDFEEYNKNLLEEGIKDLNRLHYDKQVFISNLWEEDKAALLCLPTNNYEVFSLSSVSVDVTGFAKVDTKSYSVSPLFVNQNVTAKIYFNKVVFLDKQQQHIATHKRCYRDDKPATDWWNFIDLLSNKSRALFNTDFFETLPDNWKEYLSSVEKPYLKDIILSLKEMMLSGDSKVATDALDFCKVYAKTDIESIKSVYYHLKNTTLCPEKAKYNGVPPEVADYEYKPDLTVYNLLSGGDIL
jgi:transposase